ncbi:MAG: hypothetical protein LQ338_006492 [Usnochroma carphineum]|nr:MAG: hypothetical protein LQ338_006492 [Usnochroma carphineum]
MLIESHVNATDIGTGDLPTPVVGETGTSIPTSADIHLYMEPESQFTEFPRLYADCEGLAGGERTPMAHRTEDHLFKKKADMRSDDTFAWKMREKAQSGHPRKLGFATTEETRKREFTVREFYPRLLYTFSNVIVFVLANERTFESHAFVRLLDWAATSIQSATNQSVLPHVIVVLNKSDDLLEDHDFDVARTTQRLLSDADQSLEVNHAVSRHVQYWRSSGKAVKTARDLLACFYCSVNVVRIPRSGRWMLIDKQIKKLHDLIATNCRGAHEGKRRARRDLNAEELGECLQSGLDHFTQNLYKPFDFLAFSWGLNPIAPGLEGNILRLALWVKGTPLELLEHYKPFLDGALYRFSDGWWPCSYETVKGKKCVNTKEGHARGHQDNNGKPLGPGDYKSDFDAESYRLTWHSQLDNTLREIENSMEQVNLTNPSLPQHSEEREAARLHSKRMDEFYSSLGGAEKFFSNVVCLSCLEDMPEHALPCGHVICSKCVRTFGTVRSEGLISLKGCPLSYHVTWKPDVQIILKPDQAGIRILSLDG